MSSDSWGWIEIALAVFHTYVTLKDLLATPRRRTRRIEWSRSLKVCGVEWTIHYREDDTQS